MRLSGRVGPWEDVQTVSFRGSKSRNKVSVGEPAEGSLTFRPLRRRSEPLASGSDDSLAAAGWGKGASVLLPHPRAASVSGSQVCLARRFSNKNPNGRTSGAWPPLTPPAFNRRYARVRARRELYEVRG